MSEDATGYVGKLFFDCDHFLWFSKASVN